MSDAGHSSGMWVPVATARAAYLLADVLGSTDSDGAEILGCTREAGLAGTAQHAELGTDDLQSRSPDLLTAA